MTRTPVPLPQVVGFRIRQLREMFGKTQEDVAAAARRIGFDWGRSSVASLEAGQRQLSAEELLALPAIIDQAFTGGSDAWAASFSLADLLRPGKKEELALTSSVSMTATELEGWLGAEPPGIGDRLVAADARAAEADRKAAASLGWTPDKVLRRSLNLWGQTLSDERDARVPSYADASARSLQARRGHVTRTLLNELKEADRGKRR
jgi:transcriptional regulator with XRE-family HTH domain